jgi:hypothetical protein
LISKYLDTAKMVTSIDEMEEAEQYYGSEREELRHGAPEYASSDEDVVRVIRDSEKANGKLRS